MPQLMQDDSGHTRNRLITYVVFFCLLLAVNFIFRDSEWIGSQGLHTIMEPISTVLALFVGVLSLTRFYSRQESRFLMIGVGFIGTGILEAYHALVTSAAFSVYFPSPSPSLLPWSWLAPRIFLSLFLFLSWWVCRGNTVLGENEVEEKKVYFFATIVTMLSLLFFAYIPLPRAYYPELFFGRPEEMIPALLFLLALVGFLLKGLWKDDYFEHWLILSLITGFVSQSFFMSFSFGLFDFQFDAAHLLKKLSYIFILIGLVVSLYELVVEGEQSRNNLVKKNLEIEKAKGLAESALVESEKTKLMLERMNAMMTGRELKMQKLKEKLKDYESNSSTND